MIELSNTFSIYKKRLSCKYVKNWGFEELKISKMFLKHKN